MQHPKIARVSLGLCPAQQSQQLQGNVSLGKLVCGLCRNSLAPCCVRHLLG